MLRCALKGQWLLTLLSSLQKWSDVSGHYSNDSIIRHDSSLISLLQKIKVKFEVDLENFAYLDKMWERPIYRKYELVPCKDLGLMVCSIEGK